MASLGDLLWIAALGGLFYYMMSRGGGCCGSHGHNDHKQEKHDGHESKKNNESSQHQHIETSTTESAVWQDPVCGMQIKKGAPPLRSDHLGRTFHFCSEQCRKLFDINPGRYAGRHQA